MPHPPPVPGAARPDVPHRDEPPLTRFTPPAGIAHPSRDRLAPRPSGGRRAVPGGGARAADSAAADSEREAS